MAENSVKMVPLWFSLVLCSILAAAGIGSVLIVARGMEQQHAAEIDAWKEAAEIAFRSREIFSVDQKPIERSPALFAEILNPCSFMNKNPNQVGCRGGEPYGNVWVEAEIVSITHSMPGSVR